MNRIHGYVSMFHRILYYYKNNIGSLLMRIMMLAVLFSIFMFSRITGGLSDVFYDAAAEDTSLFISIQNQRLEKMQYEVSHDVYDQAISAFMLQLEELDAPYLDFACRSSMLFTPSHRNEDGSYYLINSDVYPAERTAVGFTETSSLYRGVSECSFDDIELKRIELTEGSLFTQEQLDNGESCAIVPETLEWFEWEDASSPHRKPAVNDIVYADVEFTTEEGSRVVFSSALKVIGTYRIIDTVPPAIYLPLKTLKSLTLQAETVFADHHYHFYTQPYYGNKFTGALMKARTLSEVGSLTDRLDDLNCEYYASTDHIAPLIAAVDSVSNGIRLSGLFMVIVSFVFTLVLSILKTLRRQKETTVYFALGERKERIALQMGTETMLESAASLLFSLPAALFASKSFASYVLMDAGSADDVSGLPSAMISPSAILQEMTVTPMVLLSGIAVVLGMTAVSGIAAYSLLHRFSLREVLNNADA